MARSTKWACWCCSFSRRCTATPRTAGCCQAAGSGLSWPQIERDQSAESRDAINENNPDASQGFAAQKNSAIDKATGDWILSLDADEELDSELQQTLQDTLEGLGQVFEFRDAHPLTLDAAKADLAYHVGGQVTSDFAGLWLPRKNEFLGRWIKRGGFWPDPKLRFFRRTTGRFENRSVHEDVRVNGTTGHIRYGALVHHSYPTLSDYIDHMNRYSSLGAEMVVATGKVRFSFINIVLRPLFTFIYNYFFRLGFLDGREGLLLHLYHAVYVSWKYAKAWELSGRK